MDSSAESGGDTMDNEIKHMQVRLFRKAWKQWGITLDGCADLFDEYAIDKYISDCYEFFHVQGDESNLEEIERYIARRGAAL